MNFMEFKQTIKNLSTDELTQALHLIEDKIKYKDYLNIEDILQSRDEIKMELRKRGSI